MNKIKNTTLVLLMMTAAVTFCSFFVAGPSKTRPVEDVLNYYKANLDSLENSIASFQRQVPRAAPDVIKRLFLLSRLQYKKIEFIIEYHYPSTAEKLNGPVLPESDPSEPNEPQHPSGFQVLEELVYGDDPGAQRQQMIYELSNIQNRITHLQARLNEIELTESNIADALRLNLYRLITKGITGFDSPVAQLSLAEASATLRSMQVVLHFFSQSANSISDLKRAEQFIEQSLPDFNSFNRAVFISAYANVACRSLFSWQVANKFTNDQRATALKPGVQTLFDINAFDPMFYAPSGTLPATNAQVALGRALFAEPLLSANGNRSCKTCHMPEKEFTDGLQVNEALTGNKKLLRNTPSLVFAALQPVQFYDSHIAFLEDQAHDVISSRQEMGGTFDKITAALSANGSYAKQFLSAYPGKQISPTNIKRALASYVRSLVKSNSSFDEYMRGNIKAMSPNELKGFNLFAGKAKCATCHFMPLFSGVVPPLFDKLESEVLGVPATADSINPRMDADSGKYHLYGIPHQLYSFKTPTLRNVAHTAPYMHNGIYNTLEEVVDFYDKGGGRGLGFELPNQTLPSSPLNLTATEKQQLVSFLKALSNR